MPKKSTFEIVNEFNQFFTYLCKNEANLEKCKPTHLSHKFDISYDKLLSFVNIINVLGIPPYSPEQLFRCRVEDDIVLLTFPKNIKSRNTFFYDKLIHFLNTESSIFENTLPETIEVINENNPNIETINLAIKNDRTIKCKYNDATEKRTFLPIEVFPHRGKLYMLSVDTNDEEKKMLLLNKITDVEISSHYRFNEKLDKEFEFSTGETIIIAINDDQKAVLEEFPNVEQYTLKDLDSRVKINKNIYMIKNIAAKPFYSLYLSLSAELKLLKCSESFLKEVNFYNNKLFGKNIEYVNSKYVS